MTDAWLAPRLKSTGWLALLGGGEFTFGETLDADQLWLEKAPSGPVAFLPTASGSVDYGRHFTEYLQETFDREVDVVPIYCPRDARRERNCERLRAAAAIYLGAGVAEQVVEVLAGSPALAALEEALAAGGVIAAIGAGAEALGSVCRSLRGARPVPALGWLEGTALEGNFDPEHARRLDRLVTRAGVARGLGLGSGSVLLLGPEGAVEGIGAVHRSDGRGSMDPIELFDADDGADDRPVN